MTATTHGVQLPPGNTTLTVKLINPVNFGPAILNRFMAPPVPGLETFKTSPSLTFFLEHPSGRKLVFDLGIRKDYGNYSKSITDYLPTTKYDIQVTKNVIDVLQGHGIAGSDIEAVIWRYAGHVQTEPARSDPVLTTQQPLALGSYWGPFQFPLLYRLDSWARLQESHVAWLPSKSKLANS